MLWRIRYKLSLRELAEMFLERRFPVTHGLVRDWEAHFAPLVTDRLRTKRKGQAGRSWHIDETYIKEAGAWKYLDRTIDHGGNIVDSMLSEHRDMDVAKRFFDGALEIVEQASERVTTDGHVSSPQAIRETLSGKVVHRCHPSLNNRMEQDQRGVKHRYYPMRWFGNFDAASRFCRTFDEQRHRFRLRTTMREATPPLAVRRRNVCVRCTTLMSGLMAA